MSELRTNKIYPRDGLPAGASGGGIIQIVEGALTTGNVNGTLFSTTSSTYVDVFSVTITPTSASNKILVNMAIGPYGGNVDTLRMNGQILRDSTQVWYTRNLYFRSGGDFKAVQTAAVVLDSPATTSAVTYKFQVKVETAAGGSTAEFYADNSNYNNKMILMEVSG